ncbi:hypothetical protein ACMSDU_22285 [Bacteroides thetaiotaomicron]|uniref:hypothetical protein n=1 Tax=Bacteroides thetaiotaomicron TaxID=818 RepID=UPI0039C0AF47
MKVEISIDRETKVYELQTIAEFAANLAIRKSREEGQPAALATPSQKPNISEDMKKFANLTKGIPGVKTEETVIDSSSEAKKAEVIVDDKSPVEEVFEGNEEAKKAVTEMSEKELAAMPTDKLVKILTEVYNVDPSEYPGKNTNAKLRRLLMSASKGELEAPTQETEQAVEETKAEPAKEHVAEAAEEMPFDKEIAEEPEEEITIDMCRNEARLKIKKDRDAVLKVFKSCGCSTFATLREADYAKFYAAVKAI